MIQLLEKKTVSVCLTSRLFSEQNLLHSYLGWSIRRLIMCGLPMRSNVLLSHRQKKKKRKCSAPRILWSHAILDKKPWFPIAKSNKNTQKKRGHDQNLRKCMAVEYKIAEYHVIFLLKFKNNLNIILGQKQLFKS